MLAALQSWLQGYPNRPRPRVAVVSGNAISTARFWAWNLVGWGIFAALAVLYGWMWKR